MCYYYLIYKNTILFIVYNNKWDSKPLNLNINAYIYLFGHKNEASSKLQ